MLIASPDIAEWIESRGQLLIDAWSAQLASSLSIDEPDADTLAAGLHVAMLSTLSREETEREFEGAELIAAHGADPQKAREMAEQFFFVTLKLSRAAAMHRRESRVRASFPYKRTTVVGDTRTRFDHLALAGIVLRSDHPFWQRRQPPIDMDCRCGTILMTAGQFGRSGLALTSAESLAERDAQLTSDWPVEFYPLLDFREPPSPLVSSEPGS